MPDFSVKTHGRAEAEDRPSEIALIDLAEARRLALQRLNADQHEAVIHPPTPLLILAGAGTGKTHCLTSRIAHKIGSGERMPANILAVTFTKKAAAEMKNRIAGLIGPTAKAMDIGTFHHVCMGMLRANAQAAELDDGFTVLDEDDVKSTVKEIIRGTSAGRDGYKMEDVLTAIEQYKTDVCLAGAPWDVDMPFPEIVAPYIRTLRTANCLDFTDLLTKTVELLRENDSLARYYRGLWLTVMVDEYQDANNLQEAWLDLLSPPGLGGDLTAVGDDDQSIYGWRGAAIDNILGFGRKRGAHTVKLVENYRSTPEILAMGHRVIAVNTDRIGKVLVPTRPPGEGVRVMTGSDAYENEYDERDAIVGEIAEAIARGQPANGIAVIARSAMPLNGIQGALTLRKIPFTLTAGRRFNEAAEIKEIVAHLKLMMNPSDDSAFMTALRAKKRNFGNKAQSALAKAAAEVNMPMHAVMANWLDPENDQVKLTPAKRRPLQDFMGFLSGLSDAWAMGETIESIVKSIVEDVELMAAVEEIRDKAKRVDDPSMMKSLQRRADSINERVKQFVEIAGREEEIEEFLDAMSLDVARDGDEDAVWLGTIHGAKGLEFDQVFLPAWEPGIFPTRPSEGRFGNDPEFAASIQEERRLAHVAITRARDRLQISHSKRMRSYLLERNIREKPGNASEFIDLLGV